MAGISIGLMSLIAWRIDAPVVARSTAANRPTSSATRWRSSWTGRSSSPSSSVAVLGVMVISAEYTTGMIRSTLQAQPRRLTVLGAKIAVFAALMFVVGELLSFAAFFVGRLIIAAAHPGRPGRSRRHPVGLRRRAYLAVLGLFSLAFGAIVRHTAGAITAVLGLILIVSNLTGLLPDSWGRHINAWMPTNAGQLIFQPTLAPDDLLTAVARARRSSPAGPRCCSSSPRYCSGNGTPDRRASALQRAV